MDWGAWWDAHGETVWASIISIVITVVFGNVFYRLAEKPKRLSWEVMSRNRIIQASDDQRKNLKVIFKDHEVSNPNIVIVRIGNTGRKALLAADFPEPIRIDFGDVKLMAAEFTNISDPAIRVPIHIDTLELNAIEFTPQLFNVGEWVELQFVTDGNLAPPQITARFAGRADAVFDSTAKLGSRWRTTIRVAFVVAIASFAISTTLAYPLPFEIIAGVCIAVVALMQGYAILNDWRQLRRSWKDPEQFKAAIGK